MTVREAIKELSDCIMRHELYVELEDGSIRKVAEIVRPSAFSSNEIVTLRVKEKAENSDAPSGERW